jgi:DNA-binding SARP family transcriptional activator
VDDRIRRLIGAGETALVAGRLPEASALVEEACGLTPSTMSLRGEAAVLRARVAMLRNQQVVETIGPLQEVARELEGSDPALAARCLVASATLLSQAARHEEARVVASRARELAAGSDEMVAVQANAVMALAQVFGGGLAPDDLDDVHRLLNDPSLPLAELIFVLQQVVGALAVLQRHDEAAALARRIATAARETGSLGVLPMALCLYAHVAFWSGEWDAGMFAAAEALSLARRTHEQSIELYALACLTVFVGSRGERAAAESTGHEAIALMDQMDLDSFRPMVHGSLGMAALAHGEHAVAVGLFDAAWAALPAKEALTYWKASYVEALLEVGREDDARTVTASLEPAASEPYGRWERAQLARCRALVSGDDETWAEAQAMASALSSPFPRARGLLLWSELLARRGKAHQAAAKQSEAVALFHALGADAWVSGGTTTKVLSPAQEPTAYEVRLLGDFGVTASGSALEWTRSVPALAVKYVATCGGMVHVEQLLDILWPDVDAETGRTRLRNVLARVRATAGPLLERSGDTVSLATGTEIDAQEFDAFVERALRASDRVEAARWAAEAVVRYRGELLPFDRYAEWTIVPRERLRQRYLTALDIAVGAAVEDGDTEKALAHLERAIEADPHDESRYVAAARLHLRAGRRARASELLARARRVADELGVAAPPDLADLDDLD